MNRTALAVVLVAAFLAPVFSLRAAEQKDAAAKVEKKEKKEAKGRLPAYYARIVDDAQRDRIYKIQSDYEARIDALQAQLDALVAKRDADIRAVLSSQQLRRLDALIAEAQAIKAAKAAQKAGEAKKQDVPMPKAPIAKKAI